MSKRRSKAEDLVDSLAELSPKDRHTLVGKRLRRLLDELEDEGYEIKLELIYDQ